MKAICEDVKRNVPEVLAEWERLVREQPWFSLPPEHRIDSLPEVVVGLVEASLCAPGDVEAHRQNVHAAADHGTRRREQRVPEHLILTEYHLLRLAMWHYITAKFGSSERTTNAILRIDVAISLATNASMWGYHRPEIQAMGKWEEGIERMTTSAPYPARDRGG